MKAIKNGHTHPAADVDPQLRRATLILSLEHLRAFVDGELQTLLQSPPDGPGAIGKPARSIKATRAVEASLTALVANGAAAAGDAPPKSDYWSRMTPEERITEMARRMSKSKPSVKLERGPAVAAGDMIDGRYTKAGAAKVIGCALKSLDYVFAHHGRPESVRVAGAGGGSGLATYAPADIDAIAAARRAS